MLFSKPKVTPVRKLTDQVVETLKRYEQVCFGVPRVVAEKLEPASHLSIFGYDGKDWSEFLTIPTRMFYLLVNEVFANTISSSSADDGESIMKNILQELEAVSGEEGGPPLRPLVIDGHYTTHKGMKIRIEVALWNDNTVRLTRRDRPADTTGQ